MGIREKLDISAYLVIGPENTDDRPIGSIIEQAISAGFTIVQVRSKVCSARELIACAREAAEAIAACGKSEEIPLLIDDRLDVALAARDLGIKVDGVHVGQSDVPVEICRKHLGDDAIVGLSAETTEMIAHARAGELDAVDYIGVGPVHETATKTDLMTDESGNVIIKSMQDLSELVEVSPVPIVVGGGVKAEDVPYLAKTGVDGFFVVSAVCGAEDPYAAAKELVDAWVS